MSEMDGYDVAPGPLAMFRKLPKGLRWWLYSILATVFAVEGVLDVAEIGLIPERPQGVILGLLGLVGFTMAGANVARK